MFNYLLEPLKNIFKGGSFKILIYTLSLMNNNTQDRSQDKGVEKGVEKKPPSMEGIETHLNYLMAKDTKKFIEMLDKYKEKSKLMSKNVEEYFSSFEKVDTWINNCFDEIRNYVKVICYPLFVHLYLELVTKGYWQDSNNLYHS